MAAQKGVVQFEEVLSQEVVDIKKLRQLCSRGCPDVKGIRQLCWKLLLHYLPCEKAEWEKTLSSQRALYQQFVTEIIVNPHSSEGGGNSGALIDHPLNPNPESAWSKYFKDNEQLLQIDHDCRRLYPEISFFQQPTKFPHSAVKTGSVMKLDSLKARVDKSSLPSQQVHTSRGGTRNVVSLTKSSDAAPYHALQQGEEAHWEVCERLLFIYSKINKGLRYIQGMNEIIGPIYFVFATDPDPEIQKYAEADTFFCFATLMGEISDNFNQVLDRSDFGIESKIRKLTVLLKKVDGELHAELERQQLHPQYYAFRWLTLLLSQELFLPDVFELWDCLFSDECRFDFLYYVCCSMLMCVRDQLLANDFADNLKLLQNFPKDASVHLIINRAHQLRQQHSK